MHEKVGIFVNPTVPEYYKRQAAVLSNEIPDNRLHTLIFPIETIPDEIETTIVIGGDGSDKGITETLLKRDNPGLLLVVPAGSHNGFFAALKDANSVINLDQLKDKATSHIPHFRPGSINGEIFNHLADLTKAGVLQLKYTDMIRPYIPREMRGFAGFVVGFVKIKTDEDYPIYGFQLLMTGPNVGKYKLLPRQNIYDGTITLVSLQAKSKLEGLIKLTALLLYLTGGKIPPETVAKISTEQSFTLETHSSEINVDGELRTLPKNDTIFIARNRKSLQAAALSLK